MKDTSGLRVGPMDCHVLHEVDGRLIKYILYVVDLMWYIIILCIHKITYCIYYINMSQKMF